MGSKEENNNNSLSSNAFVQSKIYTAIAQLRHDSWKAVSNLISAGEDLHLRGAYEETYLHVLAAPRPEIAVPHVEAIAYVLSEAGIDVNARDKEGNTALHVCILNDMPLSLAGTFLRIGVDPCALNNEDQDALDMTSNSTIRKLLTHFEPGLWRAVTLKEVDKVKQVLQAWSCTDLKQDGKSLLQAAEEGPSDISACLKKHHPTAQLVHAALSGNATKVRQLLEGGKTDPETKSPWYNEAAEPLAWPLMAETIRLGTFDSARALMQVTSVNTQLDLDPPTPLFLWAIDHMQHASDEVKVTLLEKADVSKVDKQLDLMYKLWRKGFPSQALEVLVRNHKWDLSQRDSNGYLLRDLIFMETLDLPRDLLLQNLSFVDQVLAKMAVEGELEALEQLAINGYEHVIVTDVNGQTSTQLADLNGQAKCADFLKKLPDLQRSASQLHSFIRAANLQEARGLMDGVTVRAKDRAGRTALHKALLYEKTFITKHIAQNFKEIINLQDAAGRTALHYACCMRDRGDLIDVLVENGAEEDIKDQDGLTPNDYKEKLNRDFIERERTKEYGGDIYLLERYLSLAAAIQEGDLDSLRSIVDSLVHYDLNDFRVHLETSCLDRIQYRSLLFLCIDYGQTEMAQYLISLGLDVTEPGLVYTEDGQTQLLAPVDYAALMANDVLVEIIQAALLSLEQSVQPVQPAKETPENLTPGAPPHEAPPQANHPQTSSTCILL